MHGYMHYLHVDTRTGAESWSSDTTPGNCDIGLCGAREFRKPSGVYRLLAWFVEGVPKYMASYPFESGDRDELEFALSVVSNESEKQQILSLCNPSLLVNDE